MKSQSTSLLSEEFEDNFTIISGSREFRVDKFQIASRMIKFKKDPIFLLSGIYHLKTKCEDSIVENFITAAKTGKCPAFTLNNASSFQQLSIELEFRSLLHECNSFLLSQPDLPSLISNLLSPNFNSKTISDKEETLNAIETAFTFNLTQNYINQLKSLPVPVLYRILSNPLRPTDNEKALYDVIKSKIDSNDNEAKFLLSAINYYSLNHNDLSSVISHNKKSNKNQNQSHNNKSNQNQNQNIKSNQSQQQNNKSNQNQQQNQNAKSTQPQQQNTSTTTDQPQKNATDKPDNSEKNKQTTTRKSKMTRAPASIRASSTTNISDGFQAVYVPDSSDIKQTERNIIEIINTRRSDEYPLTYNFEVSKALQSYYGSLEELKQPKETDYLILSHRFSFEVQRRHLFLSLEDSENSLYDHIRSAINEIPIDDISNSNFLALTVIKVNAGYYCALIIGYSDDGTDEIDKNPIKETKQKNITPSPPTRPASSTPNLSVDIVEQIKLTFYGIDKPLDDDIHNIFFSDEYSLQLMDFLNNAEKTNEKIHTNTIQQKIPELKSCSVVFRFESKMEKILEFIKNLNKSKSSFLIAAAAKLFNNNKYFCIIAFTDQDISNDEKHLIEMTKSILSDNKSKNGISFDINIYRQLKSFIESPRDLPDYSEKLDSVIKNVDFNKYIFIKGVNMNDIEQKIQKYRIKISLSSKLTCALKKLENPESFQFIVILKY